MELLTFENMLIELEANFLEVVLIPAPDPRHSGHCVRAVAYQNCFWYRQFCKQYSSGRKQQNAKGRTRIKRQDTIKHLRDLVAWEISQRNRETLPIFPQWKSEYKKRLLEFKECENTKLIKQQQQQNQPIPEMDFGLIPF